MLEQDIRKAAEQEKLQAEIEAFLSGEDYYRYCIRGDTMNLLFGDMESESGSGEEIHRIIRKQVEKEMLRIVYIATRECDIMQQFRVCSMDFLVKPISREQIREVLKEYHRLFEDNVNFFSAYVNKICHRFVEDHIMYFVCEGRKVHLILRDGEELVIYDRMDSVMQRLNPRKFCTIHKSYIVNFHYACSFDGRDVVLTDETRLPISRSHRKQVKGFLVKWREG